ncbi:MAG: hypothetical protein QM621_10605 [Aeromicrobium sp.]|uniref:hypothetical protein n=1 Tax=Aeromicrobium sp. TaxID=1871063 RepID=UPI0039E6DEAA
MLTAVVTVSTPVSAFATDGGEGQGGGQLDLNTTVLVNDPVSAGSVGDFPIRGSLFSADFAALLQEQQRRAAERLSVAETLDFTKTESGAAEYEPVRAVLFEDYTPREVFSSAGDEQRSSSLLYIAAAVVGVPLTLVAGVLMGRFWARRKRAVS